MRVSKLRKLRETGDTIIEVLIAITIITATLGGAFVSADQSSKTTRRSQERGEALKITEGHVERFKAAAGIRDLFNKTESTYYCVNDNLDVKDLTTSNLDDFTSGTYPADCVVSPQGGVTYYVSIKRLGNDFSIRTRWDSFGRSTIEESHIYYRQYE